METPSEDASCLEADLIGQALQYRYLPRRMPGEQKEDDPKEVEEV